LLNSVQRHKEEIEDMAHVPYASVVGSLMYVMVCTRPRHFSCSGSIEKIHVDTWERALDVVKRVFRYLCGTKYYAICYQGKPETDREVNVHGFVDVDWAGDLDR
jgi:hypothetical protein